MACVIRALEDVSDVASLHQPIRGCVKYVLSPETMVLMRRVHVLQQKNVQTYLLPLNAL